MFESRWRNSCIARKKDRKLANLQGDCARLSLLWKQHVKCMGDILPFGLQSRVLLQLGEPLPLRLYATPQENDS